MEVTKREILFSTIILAIMVGLGVWISNSISSALFEKNASVMTAIKIDSDTDKFDYIGRTDAGDFLANGRIITVHPVSIPDISGEYMIIKKIKEEYRLHTRTYTTSDGKGHTTVHTQTYHSWDYVSDEKFIADSLEFLQKRFGMNDIKYHKSLKYHSTSKERNNIRYVYEVFPTYEEGCMIGVCKDKTYNDLTFKANYTYNQIIDKTKNNSTMLIVLYWIVWTIITGLLIWGFYYFANKWLEDNKNN